MTSHLHHGHDHQLSSISPISHPDDHPEDQPDSQPDNQPADQPDRHSDSHPSTLKVNSQVIQPMSEVIPPFTATPESSSSSPCSSRSPIQAIVLAQQHLAATERDDNSPPVASPRQSLQHRASFPALARTLRRDSSFPPPLPSVLPSLPPLIPVSASRLSTPLSGHHRHPESSISADITYGDKMSSSSSSFCFTEELVQGNWATVADGTTTSADSQCMVSCPGSEAASSAELQSGAPGQRLVQDRRSSTSKDPLHGPSRARTNQDPRPQLLRGETDPGETTQHSAEIPKNSSLRTTASPRDETTTSTLRTSSPSPSITTTLASAVAGDASWPENPRQYLERLKETVSKAELGNILSKGADPFHQAVLRIHMDSFDFRRDPIDLALRKFLLDFHFPKEAQQIDRVLEAFANRYHDCNSHLFRSADVVYTVAFSLMLLHTDAHNKNVRHKMSKEQYVKQAKSIEGVNTVPADILEVLYDNIIYLKFVYAEDEMDVDGQRMAEVQPPSGLWFNRRRAASNQRSGSYSMIRHGSIAHLAPDLSDLIPFRWPYYWKGTIEMVDNVQINNQFTKAPVASIPGLRSRRYSHSQDFGVSGTQPRSPGQQYPSETMEKYDSDLREILADREMDEQWNTKQDWGVKTACPSEGSAELKIVKYGILSRKIDLENGRKSTVRGWRELGVILSGSQLLFFTDVSWFHQQRNIHVGFNPEAPPEEDGYFSTVISSGMPPIPQALISTLDSIAIVDSSYQKYRHVFRLACPNGKQYLFRAESEHQMNDWMAKINYASAFKTVGVRLRSYRVSWASDVMWVKDEQGRHQLRRRHRSNQDQQKEPLDARARLIVAKIRDIDRQINICSASLAAELRLARGLEVMIPLQNTTRQKIVQSATVVGKKLRHLMLERTKLDCFRTILERDMAVVPAPMLGSNPCCHHGMGLGVHIDGSMSGTAPCGHPSCISEGSSGYAASLDHSVTPITPSNASFSPDRDIGKATTSFSNISSVTSQWSEKEEILESNNGMGGEESSGKAKPKLKLPEFHRSVSENALDEQSTARSRRTTDIPLGPLAIQAAIIDAARGNVVGVSSTMSSPDPSQYQDTQGSPVHHSQRAQTAASSPLHNQSLLTPESPTSQVAARSRALSMPGQRPSRMPRTVSIYSSSSQTASRLKRIIEQGLGHFKWKASSSTSSPVTSPSSPLSSGPSVLAPSALDYESATDDPTVASCNSASSRIVDTVPIISDDSGKTGSSLDVGLQVPYGILATGKPKAAIIPLVQEPTGMDTLDTTENQAYNKHRSGIDGKLRRQSVMEAFIGYGAADRRMDSETLLDDSEDEVIIDNPRPPPQHDSTASSGTLLEHSYVMMAKEDYTPDLHSLSDAEIEPSNSIIEHHDKESHLNLSQDTPSLSLTVDSDESWQKIP